MGLKEALKNFAYDFVHLDAKVIMEREARRVASRKPVFPRIPAAEQPETGEVDDRTWDASNPNSPLSAANPGNASHDAAFGPYSKNS